MPAITKNTNSSASEQGETPEGREADTKKWMDIFKSPDIAAFNAKTGTDYKLSVDDRSDLGIMRIASNLDGKVGLSESDANRFNLIDKNNDNAINYLGKKTLVEYAISKDIIPQGMKNLPKDVLLSNLNKFIMGLTDAQVAQLDTTF
jgi:hypothetical protein